MIPKKDSLKRKRKERNEQRWNAPYRSIDMKFLRKKIEVRAKYFREIMTDLYIFKAT